MIVCNMTIKVQHHIGPEWLQWHQQVYAPSMLATGLFADWKIFRLLEQDEAEGITWVVQYFARSEEDYQHWLQEYAPQLRRLAYDKWGDRFIAFQTVMQVVN